MRWIALQPGFVELWDVDQIDIDGWFVDDLEKPEESIHILRVLLGEADPVGLAEFDRLHHEGWAEHPPNWTGERLTAFSAAAGRLPDPRGPAEGAGSSPTAPSSNWPPSYRGAGSRRRSGRRGPRFHPARMAERVPAAPVPGRRGGGR